MIMVYSIKDNSIIIHVNQLLEWELQGSILHWKPWSPFHVGMVFQVSNIWKAKEKKKRKGRKKQENLPHIAPILSYHLPNISWFPHFWGLHAGISPMDCMVESTGLFGLWNSLSSPLERTKRLVKMVCGELIHTKHQLLCRKRRNKTAPSSINGK